MKGTISDCSIRLTKHLNVLALAKHSCLFTVKEKSKVPVTFRTTKKSFPKIVLYSRRQVEITSCLANVIAPFEKKSVSRLL